VTRSRASLELTDREQVNAFFDKERPEHVFLAAAKVGGIFANATFPADFIRENLLIQTHVIDAAFRADVKKLVFLGSSCIYPKHAPQPMRESALMTGALEGTNRAYATAKIAGIETCLAYRQQYGFQCISLMPTNLYGPHDNFDLETSHVLPALLRRMHEAKLRGDGSVFVWGSGTPRREFLHVDDLADACLFAIDRYDDGAPLNVGCGKDLTIRELAELIADIVGFKGSLEFDTSRPDGTPEKRLDVTRMRELGWSPRIPLRPGIEETYRWFVESRR
jgi:GDP-L-fucose synthase